MENIADFLKPLPVEIISKFRSRGNIKSFNKNISNQILDTIRRRPCTDHDLTKILNLHINELNKYLSELLNRDLIEEVTQERGKFFKIKQL